MLLFIPIRTDSPVRRPPRANHALIAVNLLAFLALDVLGPVLWPQNASNLKDWLMIWPRSPEVYQFFGYQFLHAGFWHLFGNLLFLWVFGNSVNCKMGNLPYLFFYLASGVFAGVCFAWVGENPLMGASGAIAGVTTAFLVLFPRSTVTVFYWLFFFIGTMHVQALLLIGAKIILWDNILSPRLSAGVRFDQVAYSAHIAGYVFGFVVCAVLLLIRALPRDQYDIVALIKRYHKRQQMRAELADPNKRAQARYGRVARPISVTTGRPIEEDIVEVPDEVTALRARIGESLARRDYAAAVEQYEALLAKAPDQCLPRRHMLDVANQLMAMQHHDRAAAAYEKYLKVYPTDSEATEVKLVLGIINAKYLKQYEAAQRYLRECVSRLRDPQHIQQANQWLDAAAAALGQGPAA